MTHNVSKTVGNDEIAKKSMPKDIIVTKFTQKLEYDEQGNCIIKRVPQRVNLTKKIQETKKLIKKDKASETLKELERIFTKEK